MDHPTEADTASSNPRQQRRLLVSMGALLSLTLTHAGATPSAEPEAVARVRATMQAAVVEAPQIDVLRSRLGAEAATVRSETGAGAPIVTWQSEGIGGGFEPNPNAVDSLRLSMPFNKPWDLGTIHDLRDASARWLETGQRATALEVAALAGQRWLDLAAATAKVALAEVRLRRLDRALLIQRKRFELGEISGSERRQIELQQASEAAILSQSEAQRRALLRELEVLAPGGFPSPLPEDLVSLIQSTATPANVPIEELLEQGPFLRFAESGEDVARLEAKHRRRAAWGRPEVEVEWQRVPNLEIIEGFDSFGFRLAYPLPIGKKGRQQIVAFEQSATAAAAEQGLVRQTLMARFEAAIETARGAEAALKALGPSISDVDATVRSLSEQFRLGAISYLVYLDGFSRLDEVLQQAVDARHLLLVARLELAEIVGTDAYFPLPDLGTEGES